ncbi:N-acetyltransferase family protein [Pseudaestuariivita sp.]|uniref:N-acetyltransferase family protein n=1 Tax=Pseudaestuariivita sp. TaxID=2211669 RepID=UPI004058D88E
MTLETRTMRLEDVPSCVAIVNHTIALGGSTAYEEPYTEDAFAAGYLNTAPVRNVTLSEGRLVGFQAAFDAGGGLYSIGTFADQQNPVKGVGRALFAKTLADCRARGGEAILAKITSDNSAGLAFYSAIGFQDFEVWPDDHTRPNGVKVDRIVKRYPL